MRYSPDHPLRIGLPTRPPSSSRPRGSPWPATQRPRHLPVLAYLSLLAACLVALARFGTVHSAELTYGPLAHEFPLTLRPGEAIEAAGPLLSAERGSDWEAWAFSPFLTYRGSPEIDAEEFDVLYPLLTYDRFGQEYKLRFFLMTTFTGGNDQEGDPVRRFTIFPFLFLQRSPDPSWNYTALFPIFGEIRDRLNRDEIKFTLFPLYSQTRRKDVVTRNYLYPIVHVREGDHLKGWQVWPFHGREIRTAFVKTNQYDLEELVPGHEKTFVLWPIYFNEHTELGTTNPVDSLGVLPFYYRHESPARSSSTYLWPFFSLIDDRAKGYREWQVPFPFLVFARGSKTMNRVFPLYSRAQSTNQISGHFLWPLYRYHAVNSPPLQWRRDRVLFFLYSNVRETNSLRGTVLTRRDLWPLYSAHRDHEGNERFQTLSLLEPFLPYNKGINHAYSPLWALWRQEHNPTTQSRSHSLLWNLYRNDQRPGSKKISLLFGLFQYQSTPETRETKLFYLSLGKKRIPPADRTLPEVPDGL